MSSAATRRQARLDAILAARPGDLETAWTELGDLLDAWPQGASLDAALHQAEVVLVDWPDFLREAPPAWKEDLTTDPTPRLRLVRVLSLRHETLGDAGAARLAGEPLLAGLVKLRLENAGIGPDGA